MPRKKHDDGHEENRNSRTREAAIDGMHSRISSVLGVPEGEDRTRAACDALYALTARTDGWLRIVPDKNGIALHAKWKFTSSRWPNHYVYYRVDRGHWSEAILGLALKVESVDNGSLKPTFDTWYGEQ